MRPHREVRHDRSRDDGTELLRWFRGGPCLRPEQEDPGGLPETGGAEVVLHHRGDRQRDDPAGWSGSTAATRNWTRSSGSSSPSPNWDSQMWSLDIPKNTPTHIMAASLFFRN